MYSQTPFKYYYNDSLLFVKDENKPFSGTYEEYYNGPVKIRAEYKNGCKNGKYLEFNYSSKRLIKDFSYMNNKLHGISKTYYKHNKYWNYLISREEYEEGKLIDGYYWHESGQLQKININGEISQFDVDSSIQVIIPFIEGQYFDLLSEYENEDNYHGYFENYIDRKVFNSQDSIYLKVAKVICSDCWGPELLLLDTILVQEYKVKSYGFDLTAYTNENGSHFHKHKSSIQSNFLDNEIVNTFKDCYKGWIHLSDIIIEDKYRIEYELPNIRYLFEKQQNLIE